MYVLLLLKQNNLHIHLILLVYNLINLIRPNVLVKGGDYRGMKVVGDDIADETKFVDFIKNKSTSMIIKKIQGET